MAWQSPLSVVYLFAVLSVWCHGGTLLFSLHAGLGSSSSHVVLEARLREVLGCGVPGSRSIALHRGKPSKSQRLEVKAHRGLVVRGSCLYPGCQTDSSTRQIQRAERGKIMTERSAAGRNRCRYRRQSHQIPNQLQPCYRGPAVQGSKSKSHVWVGAQVSAPCSDVRTLIEYGGLGHRHRLSEWKAPYCEKRYCESGER
jgi:hypothetical protein